MASTLVAECSTYNANQSIVARHCGEVFCSQDFENFSISCIRCSTEYSLFSCNTFVNHIRECFADNDPTTWKMFSEDLPKTLIKTQAVNELMSIKADEDLNTSLRANLDAEQDDTKVPLQESIFQKEEFLIEEVANVSHTCEEETITEATRSNAELFNQTDFILSVISDYRNNPSLWDVNLSSFFDIRNRKRGYLNIAKIISIQFNTKVTDVDIRKLIARLRAEYRRSQRTKDTTNRVWYYDNLSFLDVKFELLKQPKAHSSSHNIGLNDVTASLTSQCENTNENIVEEMSLKCNLCNLKFYTRGQFTSHKNAVHRKRFKCDYCDFTAKERGNINVHMQRHRGILRYPCDFCGKKFVTSTEMKEHRRLHTGEKPFVCEYCGKACRTRAYLSKHLKRHDNRRDFKCEECGSAFYTKETMIEHLVVHQDERPYKCITCNATFKLPKILKQHMSLHLPDKKYSCTICGKKFAQHAGLVSHKKTHGTPIAVEA